MQTKAIRKLKSSAKMLAVILALLLLLACFSKMRAFAAEPSPAQSPTKYDACPSVCMAQYSKKSESLVLSDFVFYSVLRNDLKFF